MPSPSRRSDSRRSRSHSARNSSAGSSWTSSYRTSGHHGADTGHRVPRRNNSVRRRSSSPPRPRPRPPSPSPTPAPNRRLFGLKRPTNLPRVPGRFDFEDKYPEDPIYEEMGDNARLWRAFLDECEVFDMDMVTESRDGLDLLLVFTGLFSAVLTTFVAQTSQALSANFPAVSSSLLVEMVALQRAQITNTPIDGILPADTITGPSGFDIWVNILWFTSLTLSLGTALMAVLVKQWLYQYMAMISGTARDRSLVHFYRFEGLEKWHVRTIIGTLPIVLHIALGLFLAGLVVFLIPLNTPLACIVGFITLIVYTLYAVSNILPLIYIQCPYRTPFSDILNVMLRAVKAFPSLVLMHVHKLFPLFGDAPETSPAARRAPVVKTLKDAERIAATNDGVAEEVARRALFWLYQMTSNPPTKRIIQESLGCIFDDVSKRPKVIQADLEQTLGEIVPATADDERKGWFRLIPSGQEYRVERVLRAVRDPLAPKGLPNNTSWRLDLPHSDISIQILTSILAHAPSISVEMNSEDWNLRSLLLYLVDQEYNRSPIHLPPRLWTHLIDLVAAEPSEYHGVFLARLCDLAVQTFDGGTQSAIPPFTGPVAVTHWMVALFHRTADLVRHSPPPRAHEFFNSEPLTKLFIIHDYAVSGSSPNFIATDIDNLCVLINTWGAISRLDNISDLDKPILCRRVENNILQMTMNEEWWDSQDDGRHCLFYENVLVTYLRYGLSDWHSNGSDFFAKLLSNLSSSTAERDMFFDLTSVSLEKLLCQHENAPVYLPLFCAAPFLSTQTQVSCHNVQFIYPVVATLVEAANNMQRDIVLQCLFAEPRRFYTICWILTCGGSKEGYVNSEEHRRETLLDLVHIDPTHVVWKSLEHYMNMHPRDWPYLRLCDEDLRKEELIADIRGKMNLCLRILNDFLASLNTSPPGNAAVIHDAPPQHNTVSHIIASSNSHWRHVQQFVSGARAFFGRSSASHTGSPSNMVSNMERGLRLGLSAESGEANPGTHGHSSVVRHSSLSTVSNIAGSSRSGSSWIAPHNYRLPSSRHASRTIVPPNTAQSAVSAPPWDLRFAEETEHTEIASGDYPQPNIHSTLQTTAPTHTSDPVISNDPVSEHPPETHYPEETEYTEGTSGESTHWYSNIPPTIQAASTPFPSRTSHLSRSRHSANSEGDWQTSSSDRDSASTSPVR